MLPACAPTLGSLFGLVTLRRVEDWRGRLLTRRLEITLEPATTSRADLLQVLQSLGASITEAEYERHTKNGSARFLLEIHITDEPHLEQVLNRLQGLPGIGRLKVERPSG